jgi:hypothetical protein
MNPYPFVGLNHLTVPVAISVPNVERGHYLSRSSTTRTGMALLVALAIRSKSMLSTCLASLKVERLESAGIRVLLEAYCKP